MRWWACGLLIFCVAGCANQAPPPVAETPPPSTGPVAYTPSPLRPFPETDAFIQCVPFARVVSGIDIYGDAWTWWEQARSRYQRGNDPRLGAVLTLRKTKDLPLGHVGVVARIKGPREILVSHANWGRDGLTRGVIHDRQPVVDVSPANDWSEIRLMNTQGKFGRVYEAHGFIYQPVSIASSPSGN